MKIRQLTIPAVVAAVVALFFGFAAPANADSFQDVVKGLKSERFYLSEDAGANLSASDRQAVVSALKDDKSTIRVAVLKKDRLTKPALKQLDRAVGKNGTLVLL